METVETNPAHTPLGNPWRRRSLKLRLAACFTLVAGSVMLGLVPLVYKLVESRLQAESDRQLDIDWSLVQEHLENDEANGIRWRKNSPAKPTSAGYANTWFDVWEGGKILLSHWPEDGVQVRQPPLPLKGESRLFTDISLQGKIPARTLQSGTTVGGRQVVLRVFRDESGRHTTLREILVSLSLGFPFAVLLAAAGGYLMAGRALAPLTAMTGQARLITSESLGRRLPNPNPYDELGQLATVINHTLGRLEASFESLKRFTADASHELRTPLTALRSVGEVALRENCDAHALRETIGSVLEESQRLTDLIDAMLMFARVEGGASPLHLEAVRLDELVRETCESVEVLAIDKRQNIVLAKTPSVTVLADRLLLRHALMNILHNAIRHSPTGSAIRVKGCLDGVHACVAVSDDGPGIATRHQAKIFERFYRIDDTRSRSGGGAGLGLAIAKLSVERMGGSIRLASAPGQGCTFSIILPPAQGS
jgi:heavy metal sensor kinase